MENTEKTYTGEVFPNPIDPVRYQKMNKPWNDDNLSGCWTNGCVSGLISGREWKSKEEWEAFYYESGRQRYEALANDEMTKNYLDKVIWCANELHGMTSPSFSDIPYEVRLRINEINRNHGRTREDMQRTGQVLLERLHAAGMTDATLEECTECVRQHIVCETWDGAMNREKNTIRTMEERYGDFEYLKTNGKNDNRYAVDYLMCYKSDHRCLCGIQIKPETYFISNRIYLVEARESNERRNEEFSQCYGVPVLTVASSSRGEISNHVMLDFQIENYDKVKKTIEVPNELVTA